MKYKLNKCSTNGEHTAKQFAFKSFTNKVLTTSLS